MICSHLAEIDVLIKDLTDINNIHFKTWLRCKLNSDPDIYQYEENINDFKIVCLKCNIQKIITFPF